MTTTFTTVMGDIEMAPGAEGAPTWVASGEGHVSAWVHMPTANPVGCIVIAPPTAREGVVSFRAMRALAIEAASAGFIAIRFTWRGEGDSSGHSADDAVVANWHEDLDSVIDLAADLWPGEIQVIGVRLGAALVSRSTHPRIGQRLLWEPVAGRRFLRQHTALRQMSMPHPVIDERQGTEVIGTRYSPASAAAISSLSVLTDAPDTVVRREDDPETALRLHSVASPEARVPREAIAELIATLRRDRRAPVEPFRTVARIAAHDWDAGITETLVSIGPDHLPGVVTAPANREPLGALVLCAGGAEPKDGPSGLWTIAARQMAARGVVVVRTDRRGVGDAMASDDDREPNPYTQTGVDDAVATLRYARALTDGPLIAAGLCAGAWTLVKASMRVPVDRLVSYNNVAWASPVRTYADYDKTSMLRRIFGCGGESPATTVAPVEAGGHRTGLVRVLRDRVAEHKDTLKSVRDTVRAASPLCVLRVLAQLGLAHYPAPMLESVPSRTRVTLVFGDEDLPAWSAIHGHDGVLAALRHGHQVEVRVEAALDHAMFSDLGRHLALHDLAKVLDSEIGQLNPAR